MLNPQLLKIPYPRRSTPQKLKHGSVSEVAELFQLPLGELGITQAKQFGYDVVRDCSLLSWGNHGRRDPVHRTRYVVLSTDPSECSLQDSVVVMARCRRVTIILPDGIVSPADIRSDVLYMEYPSSQQVLVEGP